MHIRIQNKKKYVIHWKKIFNFSKYYNIRVHQRAPQWGTPYFKVTHFSYLWPDTDVNLKNKNQYKILSLVVVTSNKL